MTNVLIDNTVPPTPAKPTGLTSVSAAPTITFAPVTDPLAGGVASGVDHYDITATRISRRPRSSDHRPAARTPGARAAAVRDPATARRPTPTASRPSDKAGNTSATRRARDPPRRLGRVGPDLLTPQATPTNQRPHVSWAAPTAPGFTHYKRVPRRRAIDDVATTGYTDLSTEPGRRHLHLSARRGDAGDTTLGLASAPPAVSTTRPRRPRPAASPPAQRSMARSRSAGPPRRTERVRRRRYVVRRSLSSTPPATPADGDAVCQGTARRARHDDAHREALQLRGVRGRHGRQHLGRRATSHAVTARDQRRRPRPRASRPRPATPRRAERTPAGADDDVAGYVLVAKRARRRRQRDRRDARVRHDRRAAVELHGERADERRRLHVRPLRARRALNRSAAAVVTARRTASHDTTAPAAVRSSGVKVVGHKVTLTWKNPSDTTSTTSRSRRASASPPPARPPSASMRARAQRPRRSRRRSVALVRRRRLRHGRQCVRARDRARRGRPGEPVRPRRARRCTEGEAQLAGREGREVLQRADLRRQEADPRQLAERAALQLPRPSSRTARPIPGTSGPASAPRPRRTTASCIGQKRLHAHGVSEAACPPEQVVFGGMAD